MIHELLSASIPIVTPGKKWTLEDDSEDDDLENKEGKEAEVKEVEEEKPEVEEKQEEKPEEVEQEEEAPKEEIQEMEDEIDPLDVYMQVGYKICSVE